MYKFSMNCVADTKGLDYEKSFCFFFLKVWFYVRHIIANVACTITVLIGTAKAIAEKWIENNAGL